jgi:hypothetical protein
VILLWSRAVAIVVRPHATWASIARERTSPLGLFLGYVVPLAAIGPLATFIALHVVGVRLSRVELYRASIGEALGEAAISFVYALAGVALIAFMLTLLAPLFGAGRGFARALRVTAYAYTPAWLAGVLLLYPPLQTLQLIAVGYALYLLALGVHDVISVSRRRAVGYTAAALAGAVAAAFGIGALAAGLHSAGFGPH